jgi:hypothetical protein
LKHVWVEAVEVALESDGLEEEEGAELPTEAAQ